MRHGCGYSDLQDPAEEVSMQTGLERLYRRGDPGAAVAVFQGLLERHPGHYGATQQLAAALDANAQRREARPYWERVRVLAERVGDRDAAERARQRLEQTDAPDAATLMRMGLDALYQRHDAAAAVENFRKILEENPTHYGAHYQLAAALDAVGKREEARAQWEKVLSLAESAGDTPTADTARARLAQP